MAKKHWEKTAPELLERRLLDQYPDLTEQTARMLGVKLEEAWPDWCYLPMGAAFSIASQGAERSIALRFALNDTDFAETYRALAAIIPWRLYKCVYRFDSDLAAELMELSVEPDNVPTEVLLHMPYPCVFIADPPGIDGCIGVFFFWDWDGRHPDSMELRQHYLFSDGTVEAAFIVIGSKADNIFAQEYAEDVELQEAVSSTGQDAFLRGLRRARATDRHIQIQQNSMKHLNLLLYLCSDEPDITEKGSEPVRKGKTVQVAAYTHPYEVGNYVGSVIRKARANPDPLNESAGGTSSTKRPHMRRAHWHTYWYGSNRDEPRVKWLSPIFVHGAALNDTPVVIHPVR